MPELTGSFQQCFHFGVGVVTITSGNFYCPLTPFRVVSSVSIVIKAAAKRRIQAVTAGDIASGFQRTKPQPMTNANLRGDLKMVHRSVSSQVPSPRDRGRPVSARHSHGRSPRRSLSIHTARAGVDAVARPVAPAEAAQARHFEKILHPELLQLRRRLDLLAADQRMRDEARELTARIAELHRLLTALGARFGQPAKPAALVRRDRFLPSAASRN